MRLGVHLVGYDDPSEGPAGIARLLAQVGRACDEAGVDVLSCMDHWFQLGFVGAVDDPMLEGYTTLGFLAASTERVELQLLVTGVTYRPPGLLAKTVATLDVLSGGRATLGIGAAWYEREHLGLGVPFPPLRERFDRLEETLQIVRQMWSEDDGPFEGRHYRLAETICSPQPLHRIPVMVGGTGERRTLRLVAQYADACNLVADRERGRDFVAGKLDVLRGHCEREGRSYDDVRRTVLWTSSVDAAFLDQMRAMADLGVQEVHVTPPAGDQVAFVQQLGERVVPVLRGL